MKGLYYLVLSLMLAVGCTGSAGRIAKGDVVLQVEVVSPVANDVILVHHNEISQQYLDADGCAVFTLENVDAGYIKLFHGRESLRLYVEGGDVAKLTFRGGRMTSAYSFEGAKEQAVKYLNTISLVALLDEAFALEFDEYVERLKEKENDALKILKATDLSSAKGFLKMEQARIKYSYGSALLMYPVGHMMMNHNASYRPDESYYEMIDSYVLEDEQLAALDEYRAFVSEAMHVLDADNRNVREVYPKTVAQMRYAADRFKKPEVREIIIHHIAAEYVDNFGVKGVTELENIYNTYVHSPELMSSMVKKYERWDLSLPGKFSPSFKAEDINGKEYTLADFKGKYVYIDLWATWCGPCKREFPYMKALEKEFEGAQIVLLGLSVDKDKQAWKKMVRSGELTGVQLYLGPQSKFQEAYRVEGIPRFILLDKEGRIINNDMFRPSEEMTAQTLRNLEEIR